ncbi:OsmC family protein [Microvenator marinus]|nr:OsmC family protein [Microvenator marinus]
MENIYSAQGSNVPQGKAEIRILDAEIEFDGTQGMGTSIPGPAHLLASSLAACLLKNVERFHHRLPFEYTKATAHVELERQDAPPKIILARFLLEIETDENPQRCALLHKNVRKYGTITNTLSACCTIEGTLRAVRTNGTTEDFHA